MVIKPLSQISLGGKGKSARITPAGRVHRFKLIGRPMRDAYEWMRNYQRFW